MKFVSIILESKSDAVLMSEATKTFEKFGVKYELLVSSAYRSLGRTQCYIKEAEAKGAQVFIAATGTTMHLASSVASMTTRPVMAVSTEVSSFTAHGDIPMAMIGTGKAGAASSAFLAMQILALWDAELDAKLKEDCILKAKKVETDSQGIDVRLA
jgi:5-(carboxyamino)imidazole ribonucleotide mutase